MTVAPGGDLVLMGASGFGRDPGDAEVGDRRSTVPLRELRPVLAEQQHFEELIKGFFVDASMTVVL